MSDRDSNTFVWFLAGLGLGALAGVLYAPRSGAETREVLRARAEEGRDYVRGRAREEVKFVARRFTTRSASTGTHSDLDDFLDEQLQDPEFRAAYEAGRQAYHEATADTGTSKNL